MANRVAAGANALGVGSVMLGTGGVETAATLVGINASTDWIPVVGQVVMLGTGIYLAGDWAYHKIKPFHSFVNSTAEFVAHHPVHAAVDALFPPAVVGVWAYHNVKPFHNFVNSAAHLASGIESKAQRFVGHGVLGWI